jgi:hypothetical protein
MSAALYVKACALWSPEYSDAAAWLSGRRGAVASAPPALLLPTRARGRASLITGMLAETVGRAASDGGADLSTVPVLIGSAFGEMATTVRLLEMMGSGDGALSPARFQASVHNTAAGAISIATANRSFSSCLSAGDATCSAVLIEAWAWLAASGGELIAAVADESLPPFFASEQGFGPLAAALMLSAEPSGRVIARIAPPEFVAAPCARDAPGGDAEPFARNPAAALLPLLRAALSGQRSAVSLPGLAGSWRFELTPPEAS